MKLRTLVPGDPVECSGTVVQTRTGHALLRFDVDSPPRTDLYELHWPSAASVDISLSGGGEAALVGSTVAVTGTWTGTGVTSGEWSPTSPPPPTVETYTPEDPSTHRYLDADQIRRARPDVMALYEEGVLVSHVRSYVEVRVIAHDPRRADEVLRPHYGEALTVRQCPFPPSVLRLVDDLSTVADADGVLLSIGGDFDFDFTRNAFIEVSYVTDAMRTLAREIPDGAVSVIAQATPVARPVS